MSRRSPSAAALVASLVAALVAGCAHKTPQGGEKDETEEREVTAPPSAPTTTPPPSGATLTPPTQPVTGPLPKPLPTKIKIIVRTKPDKALVFWGKKKLGETPVTLERPRDSGPVDLVVRSDGFFPLHTRAYTFHNDVLYLRLTKLEDRMTIHGAKREANEPPPGGPDGGSPPPSTIPAPAPAQ
jgi:hypothetical protein